MRVFDSKIAEIAYVKEKYLLLCDPIDIEARNYFSTRIVTRSGLKCSYIFN